MIKKALGLAPTPTANGAYQPAPLALKMATSDTTDYDGTHYPNKYTGGRHKVLMLCTEYHNFEMANGKAFFTGNHPVETFVPMLHLQQAGFKIDIVTPTGASVKLEEWAMPAKDEHVRAIRRQYQQQLQQPMSLADFVQEKMDQNTNYTAIFIPGGHGAMIDLPKDENVGHLLRWAHANNRLVMTICHGPAALLATAVQGASPYRGYATAAFPDSADKMSPWMGYLPGPLPWYLGEALANLEIEVVNSLPDKTCHVDRKLISGASPYAANDFGKLCATELLKHIAANS